VTFPTDRDERIEQFHAMAQSTVWEWKNTSKLRFPIADTMDPLSCLTQAIVQKMEEVYQGAKAVEEPPKGGITKLFGLKR
jgi:hypothetical protein